MLLRFRCKNFRSIREEQELSMVAARTEELKERLIDIPKAGLRALRCAAIYGPNASGKSNILSALSAFSDMIQESQRKWDPADTIPYPFWNPYVLDDVSGSDETEFSADILIEGTLYTYGFRFNENAILEEWLRATLSKKNSRERTIFHRTTSGKKVQAASPSRMIPNRILEAIRSVTRPNSLFLSAAAQNNHELLKKIYIWFALNFNHVSPENHKSRLGYTFSLCEKKPFKALVRKALSIADFGISDFNMAADETDESEVTMIHSGANGKSYSIPLFEESRGTQWSFALFGPVFEEIRRGGVLLIDELESSIHPLLAREIVRILNDPRINRKGAQFIFTTHNTNLLSDELLRRDQVWFTQKSPEGATSLYSLAEFKPLPRKNQDLASGYLHGRFDAIPFLDSGALGTLIYEEEPAGTA